MSSQPYVTITEQPAGKQQRFRYLSEVDGARSVGSIPGVNSTPERKTFPSIRVHGYKGPFVVLLSLLNPDNYLVHPHSITGSDPRYKCKHGVIFVLSEEPDVVFKNIGILCVKGKTEKDVKSALKMRSLMDIDPFRARFPHLDDHRQIDFTAVRLCFQVLLPGPDWTPADRNNLKTYTRSLPAVVSDVVYDAKKLNDLKIVYINSCAGPTSGGNEMTLLCDKYTGQNPDVVFEDERGWTQTASVKMYHKQLAIVFVAPPYRDQRDRDNLQVKVYLQQTHEQPNGQHRVLRSRPATVEYLPYGPKGSPLKFPTPPPPSYPGNKMNKSKSRGKSSNTSANCTVHYDAVTGASSVQPHDLKHDFKMPPSSRQEYSPSGDIADPDHNALNAYMPSTSRQINSINVVPATRRMFGMNIQDSINPYVANVNGNNNINPLPTTSGVNNVETALNHRFSTTIPPGTKVKREKHQGPDSGELPKKRDKPTSDLEAFLYDISPSHVNSNNPFIDTNGVPNFFNEVAEFAERYLNCFGPEVMTDVTNAVAEGDRWHWELVNNHNTHPSVNQPLQHEHAIQNNVAQHEMPNNIIGIIPDNNFNIDHLHNLNQVECVSAEMRKMKFDG